MGWKPRALAALLILGLVAHSPSSPGQEDDAGTDGLDALLDDYDERRLADCSESPSPVLNEVCSVGVECDEDVRVGDFVELYNPSARAVDLECFVVTGREGPPFVGRGEVPPHELRGIGEGELGFRIRKARDEIALLRISSGPDGEPELRELDSVRVDAGHALSFRSPDGGSWRSVPADEVEGGGEPLASFGRQFSEVFTTC